MTNNSLDSRDSGLNGGLFFSAGKRNFPIQVVTFISFNSKLKSGFFTINETSARWSLDFFEEILNKDKNKSYSKSISSRLISDLILILGVKLPDRRKRLRVYLEKTSKGFDFSFFSNIHPPSLVLFFLETRSLKKSGGREVGIFEEIFPCFFHNKKACDYLIETNQMPKIIDSMGICLFDEYLAEHENSPFTKGTGMLKIIFHALRKSKNYKSLIETSKWFKTINEISISVREPVSFSERACMVASLEKAEIISIIILTRTSKPFLKWIKSWIKNCVHYKNSIHSSLKRILDLNSLEDENRHIISLEKKTTPQVDINQSFLLGKSSFSKYFFQDDESNNFLGFFYQIEEIANGFSGPKMGTEKSFEETSFLKNFNENLLFFRSRIRYHPIFFEFFFSWDFLEGLENLKNKIEKTLKLDFEEAFEYKIILSVVLMGNSVFSDRLFYFLLRNIKIRYASTFFLTGYLPMKKNLESLILGTGILFTGSKNILPQEYFNRIVIFFKNFLVLSQKKKKIPEHYISTSRHKLDRYSTNNITGLLLFSFSLIHFSNFKKKAIEFSKDIISFLKFLGDSFFWDLKKKHFQIYTMLSFGILYFGKKNLSFVISIYLNEIENKKIRTILRFFIQICSHVGTSDLKLITSILKDIENYSFKKTKRLQRLHLIQHKFKKNKNIFYNRTGLVPINDYEEKKTFHFVRLKVKIGILGLAILSLNDDDTKQMIFRIFSYFFSNNDLEYSRICILTFGLFFLSDPESSSVDFLIKLTGSKDWKTVKNSIFSLGLIGAGTNNSRIINALNYLGKFYISKIEFSKTNKGFSPNKRKFLFGLKVKSILSTLRISQGLVSSSKNFLTIRQFFKGQTFDFLKIASLLCVLEGFFDSGFIGFESVPISIFLLVILFQTKTVCSLSKNLKIKSILIKKKIPGSSKEKIKLTPFFRDSSPDNFFSGLSLICCK